MPWFLHLSSLLPEKRCVQRSDVKLFGELETVTVDHSGNPYLVLHNAAPLDKPTSVPPKLRVATVRWHFILNKVLVLKYQIVGFGETAEFVKCLQCENEEVSSIPNSRHRKQKPTNQSTKPNQTKPNRHGSIGLQPQNWRGRNMQVLGICYPVSQA